MESQTQLFDGVKQAIEQFKAPGVDIASIVAARGKDIEALVEANKAAYVSMQALAAKQAEMMAQAMRDLQESAKGVTVSVGDPTRQTEVVRKAFDKILANMTELAQMTRNSQSDALAHLTKRGNEHLHEIQQLMRPK